jgi:hypothetical protein
MLLHNAFHASPGGGHNVSAPQSFIPARATITYVTFGSWGGQAARRPYNKSLFRPATR